MDQPSTLFRRSDFPEDFVFGAATSAYQIEGSSFGNCGTSQWDVFAETPGNVVRAEHGGIACDHYHRFKEDFDLVRNAGLNAYRFSTSWARVMPEGRGAVNPEGLDHYDRLVDALLERDLQPWACLYHWELPAPLLDLGGWRNRDIASWFADFAEVIMGRIGDRLHAAATFNEPWCIAWLSHFMGHHAPGLRDIRAATRAMHHVLLAHGRAIEVMRGLGMNNLGVVCNFEFAQPATNSSADKAAAKLYDGIYNRWFLGGLFKGAYPEDVLEGLAPHMPDQFEKDFPVIQSPVDWLGINYYTRKLIAADPGQPFPAVKEVEGPLSKTTMGWEVYPEGLEHFITWAAKHYCPDLPIFVTENGMSSEDVVRADGSVSDPQRIDFLRQHFDVIRSVRQQGVDLRGYFIWSLLDNYEWALGYEKRFGLVHVDFESLTRTPKQSYDALRSSLLAGSER